jgi:hypothetical protein
VGEMPDLSAILLAVIGQRCGNRGASATMGLRWVARPTTRRDRGEPFAGHNAIADGGNKSDVPRVLQFEGRRVGRRHRRV